MSGRRTKVIEVMTMMMGLSYFGINFARAEAVAPDTQPWEKFGVSAGAFITDTDSSVRVGSGLGVDVDLEKALGMESKNSVFRADADWRFSQNRKHRLDLSWFALHRSANRQIGQDFDITDSNGNTTTIQAGSQVASRFNLDIIETAYSYSFLQDDRVDLAAVFGLYVMPIKFGLQASGAGNAETSLNFSAPLPVLGFRMDLALTPKWFVRSGYQFLYVQYEGFVGKVIEVRGALEYLPFKHVGFGLGYDTLRASLSGRSNQYPGVNLDGSVQFQYTGLQLYGKFFF